MLSKVLAFLEIARVVDDSAESDPFLCQLLLEDNSEEKANGGCESFKALLRYVERENIEGVRSWGEKYGSEKDEIIMQMHVLVYAPTAKDLALPVLEAAACSVPSIVAVESNIVDWLGRMPCFQFAKGQSEQEWIKAMASVFHCYSGEQFEQSVEGMRNLLNETFNWEKLIPRYRKLYQI